MNKQFKKDFFSLVGLALAVMLTTVALISPYRLVAANIAPVLTVVTNRTALLTNAVHINSITVYNQGTNNAIFAFFDGPGTTNIHSANAIALGQTNGGFTNFTFTIGQVTNTYTNIYGFITNDIFTAMIKATNAQAPTLALYQPIATMTVGSNQTVTLPFNALQFCNFGLFVTNLVVPVGTVGINVDYNALK